MTTNQPDSIPNKTQIAVKHTRGLFWQVLFPIIFASLLVIGLLIYLVVGSRSGGVSLAQFSGVATIILIMPALMGLVFVLAIFVAKIYLLAKLTGVIPGLAQKVILAFGKAKTEIQKVADGAANPFIKLSEIIAKAQQVFDSLQKRLK